MLYIFGSKSVETLIVVYTYICIYTFRNVDIIIEYCKYSNDVVIACLLLCFCCFCVALLVVSLFCLFCVFPLLCLSVFLFCLMVKKFGPRLHLQSACLESFKGWCLENPAWRKNIFYTKFLHPRCLGKNFTCKGLSKQPQYGFFKVCGHAGRNCWNCLVHSMHGSRPCLGRHCATEKIAKENQFIALG